MGIRSDGQDVRGIFLQRNPGKCESENEIEKLKI
jgi:hypothetical protein